MLDENSLEPLVSVVLPCNNSQETLEETLLSLCQQTFPRFELVVIDDASTDCTLEVVEQFRSKFDCIKIVRSKDKLGPGGARNLGIENSTARFIAFLDSDDTWRAEKLEAQLKLHKSTDAVLSCTGYKMGNLEVRNGKTDFHSLLKNNVVNTSSIMFDRNKISVMFDSKSTCEDYALWLKLSKNNEITFLNEVLVDRRKFGGISSNKLAMATMRWNIYRNQVGLGWVSSLYYFSIYAVTGLYKYLRL